MLSDLRAVPSGTELSADVCIVGAGAAGITAGSMDEPAALGAVEDAVVDDFRGGATVRLSGWSLGRTELRQCALLALRRGN